MVINALSQYEFERPKYTQDLINFEVKFGATFWQASHANKRQRRFPRRGALCVPDFRRGIDYGESTIVRYELVLRTERRRRAAHAAAGDCTRGGWWPSRSAGHVPIELMLLVFTGDTATASLEDLAANLQEIVYKTVLGLRLNGGNICNYGFMTFFTVHISIPYQQFGLFRQALTLLGDGEQTQDSRCHMKNEDIFPCFFFYH